MKTLLPVFAVVSLMAPYLVFAQEEIVSARYDATSSSIVFQWDSPNGGKKETVLESFNRVNPQIHAEVSVDSTGSFLFSYKVTNLAGAQQTLSRVSVKHFAPVFEDRAPGSPGDWLSTENTKLGARSWVQLHGSTIGVPAGTTLSGFSFKSKGLPGVVRSTFSGKRKAEFVPPNPDEDGFEVMQSFNRVYKSITAQHQDLFGPAPSKYTVGPIDPPASFNLSAAIRNLADLTKQSRSVGWIDNDGNANSLLAKVNSAAKFTEPKAVKNVVGAFMNEVQAQNGKHLNAEAYAVLYYNAKYIADHL